jgi:hypothetical protein
MYDAGLGAIILLVPLLIGYALLLTGIVAVPIMAMVCLKNRGPLHWAYKVILWMALITNALALIALIAALVYIFISLANTPPRS